MSMASDRPEEVASLDELTLGNGASLEALVDRRALADLLQSYFDLFRVPLRIYGADGTMLADVGYISEDEVKDVCDFLRAQAAPVYDENILKPRDDDDDGSGLGGGSSNDPQYDRAVALVAQAGYCSISHIQRHLSIGYNKAAMLVERMEQQGVVGPPSGKAGGRREVFVDAR